MNLAQLLDQLKTDERFLRNVTRWEVLPPEPARYADVPAELDPRLARVLAERGIERLYSHQAEAVRLALQGRSLVVPTPTASGKTLCYNLPVLDTILREPQARALYLFPTKALSQDQMHEVHGLVTDLGADIKTFTFDGDTPETARRAIRSSGHIVVTNPDMLHQGILPHHTLWVKLFENLRYVVVDEVHQYRGVFGSHVANVLRRLQRIARFYGADPVFICCSATIANPQELAERLTGREVDGGRAQRRAAGREALHLLQPAGGELGAGHPPVGGQDHARHRRALHGRRLPDDRLRPQPHARGAAADLPGEGGPARGHHAAATCAATAAATCPTSGAPSSRACATASVTTVVSTNALELGIDIGRLDVCVMAGYAGTIASTWQQAGRAGRRQNLSCVVLVASSSPADQYVVSNPDYFFGRSPEHATLDPDNLVILMSHLKCAAFELPFAADERYGGQRVEEILGYLADQGVLHRSGDRFHWMADTYPAEDVSLRSAAPDNVVIIDRRRCPGGGSSARWTCSAPRRCCTTTRSTSTGRSSTTWTSWTGSGARPTCSRSPWTTTPTPSARAS